MSAERIMIIGAGAVAMLILMLLRRKRYPNIPPWKMILISLILTVCGVLGAMLLFFVENGRFGGTSFFGAVLLAPVLMWPFGKLLRVPYGELMDLCAPAECAMLAVLKIDCLRTGCCAGAFIPQWGCTFPSQIAEMSAAILLLIILVQFEKKDTSKGFIYPLYLGFYGSIRLVLNGFRAEQNPFVWILPPGHFWAIVSIAIGLLVLWAGNNRET